MLQFCTKCSDSYTPKTSGNISDFADEPKLLQEEVPVGVLLEQNIVELPKSLQDKIRAEIFLERNTVGQCTDEFCACKLIVPKVDFEARCRCKKAAAPWVSWKKKVELGDFCVERCAQQMELLPGNKAYYVSSIGVRHEISQFLCIYYLKLANHNS
jgi:hypothetical protein